MKRIYIVGTADTKGEELIYLRELSAELGAETIVVDVGTRAPAIVSDISYREVAGYHPDGATAILEATDRGVATTAMAVAFSHFISSRSDLAGVLGIGGGGGTSIVTAGMRELPIGLPKLMVSTVASADVSPFVGVSDITMMYSVTDIAGLNRISRTILRNAANAIVAMARGARAEQQEKPSLALTMFGVTTPSVMQATAVLRADYDCLVFHATGTGGRAMEKLVDSGLIAGVIDVTTTEIADLLVGGVMSAGEDRLGAISRTGVPYVGSVGALDMVNFWGPESVPERFRGRLLHKHNAQVTLMRTTVEENRAAGTWIADRLNRCDGPVRILLPEKGISAMDAPGRPFYDPTADAALFDAIELRLRQTETRRFQRLPFHINDPAFSDALVSVFRSIVG